MSTYKVIEIGKEEIVNPKNPKEKLLQTTRTVVKSGLSWKEAKDLAKTNKQYEVVRDRS